MASRSSAGTCPLFRKQKLSTLYKWCTAGWRPEANIAFSSSPSFLFFFFLLLIIKQDFACHVNASITFDTVISDLSSWVKLSAEVPGQTSLIRKKVTLPQMIRIQSVWVPPGNWFWKEQLMEAKWGGLMGQHQVPGQQVSPGRS